MLNGSCPNALASSSGYGMRLAAPHSRFQGLELGARVRESGIPNFGMQGYKAHVYSGPHAGLLMVFSLVELSQ